MTNTRYFWKEKQSTKTSKGEEEKLRDYNVPLVVGPLVDAKLHINYINTYTNIIVSLLQRLKNWQLIIYILIYNHDS